MSNNFYEQSEDQNPNNKQTKKLISRFVKNRMDNISNTEIVINLSRTQYDIIQSAAQQLGWIIDYSKKSQNWDIKWVDTYIQPQELFRLNDHQKISHFPGIDIFAKKNLLGKNLMKMKKYFPIDYDFFPDTWSLPSQFGDLKRHNQKTQSSKEKEIYIFKPSDSCQGKGIKLIQNIEDLQGKNGIAQIYLNNPLLIENLKFDLRLYVLIYGNDPMRIYLYDEGLARFATEKYAKAEKANMKENYVHLTNYAINKNNKKFIFNKDEAQMDKGHKRSITSVYKYLESKSVNVQILKNQIQSLIVKTLIIGQPLLSHVYYLSQSDNSYNDSCFHILGFDILITDDFKPILLQINHTPSFATDTPLDKKIKKNLIKDTFKILNVNIKSKIERISKKIQFLEKRSQRKTIKLTNEEKNSKKKNIEQQKNYYQVLNICGYKRIYPRNNKDDKNYKILQINAKRIFQQENRFRNKLSPIKSPNSGSPTKSQRQVGKISTINIIRRQQYGQKSKLIKKWSVSQTLSLRSHLPFISLSHQGKQSKSISMSANFSKNVVKRLEFNGEDIFKEIQTKRIRQTQRIQKIKKTYLTDQNIVGGTSKIDLILPHTLEKITLPQKPKVGFLQKQIKFIQFLKESSQQIFAKRGQSKKLKDILFKKVVQRRVINKDN